MKNCHGDLRAPAAAPCRAWAASRVMASSIAWLSVQLLAGRLPAQRRQVEAFHGRPVVGAAGRQVGDQPPGAASFRLMVSPVVMRAGRARPRAPAAAPSRRRSPATWLPEAVKVPSTYASGSCRARRPG